MSEGLAITLTIIVTTIVGIGMSTMFYARCRDCRAKIYKHSKTYITQFDYIGT